MVLAVCKFLEMVDAVMDETAHVQLVVAAQTIGDLCKIPFSPTAEI